MSDREFSVVCSALDDCRRLIAAGKTQRWDVVKWGVTIDLALAAVAVSTSASHEAIVILFVVAVTTSVGSWLLVWHYNRRMTGARKTAVHLVNIIRDDGVNYDRLLNSNLAIEYSKGLDYDREELDIFRIVLICGPLLVLLRYLVG